MKDLNFIFINIEDQNCIVSSRKMVKEIKKKINIRKW